MTNKEKAHQLYNELSHKCNSLHYGHAVSTLVRMAEWKDQQHAKECESLVGLAVKESRQVFIDRACEWLEMQVEYYVFDDGEMEVQYMLEDFRKAMEE